MKGIPVDVVQFIEWRFATRDLRSVLLLLDQHRDMTPRVLRAVLFLSDGSLTLLRFHLHEAHRNVRQTLLAAEFVQGVGETPMFVRDMSEPFLSEKNLGPDYFRTRPLRVDRLEQRSMPPRANRAGATRFHHALLLRRFTLGKVTYVVMSAQTSPKYVRCYRIDGKLASLVQLPLEFVVEQLAEKIEMDVARHRY